MTSEGRSESVLAKVSRQLAALEKRDWELWVILSGTGILVGAGLLTVLFPAAILRQGSMHIELEVSRELFVGLVAVLILFNTYIIGRRLELRRTREAVISNVVQTELLRLQSFTDPLTEVYNRRSLEEIAHHFMSRSKRTGKSLTLMIVDMDRFKEVNTRFGHLTGDFVLAEAAAILKSAVRGSDAVVRYGGDEFLVFLSDAAIDGGKEVAARIARYLGDWNAQGHLQDFELTLSIGLAEWSPEKTLDEALTEADQKMYSIKDARKSGAYHK